jgi:hypothetical protein
MVHILFDGGGIRLDNFYQSGTGTSVGSGGGSYFEGLPLKHQRGYGYFAGLPRQRGHGLGDVFKSLWRVLRPMATAIAPMAKEAGKAIGQEGLAAGARVLNDLVQGKEAGEALSTEGREGVKRLLDRASTRLQKGTGPAGRRGGARKYKSGNSIVLKPGDLVTSHSILRGKRKQLPKKKNTKRQRIDNLGFY